MILTAAVRNWDEWLGHVGRVEDQAGVDHIWMTDFRPTPDFAAYQSGDYDPEADYERECSARGSHADRSQHQRRQG